MNGQTVIGWMLTPANGGNKVFLSVRYGYRERDDGRVLDPYGKPIRLARGARLERVYA